MSLIVQTGNSEASLDQQDINYAIILELTLLISFFIWVFFFPPLKLLTLVRNTSG